MGGGRRIYNAFRDFKGLRMERGGGMGAALKISGEWEENNGRKP